MPSRSTVRGSAVVLALATLTLGPTRAATQQEPPPREGPFSLEGLVVTASPTPVEAENVAGHVTILAGDELRARGRTTLAEAIRDEAGVDVVRSGSFGSQTSLFLRGAESDHVLVLVDGVQVNQAGGGFDFASLTLDDVERVEILRGPASALYGSDAVAGVIHVITRTGSGAPRLTASAEAASFGEPRDELLDGLRLSAELSGGSDAFAYSASLGREDNDGILAFNNGYESTVLAGSARFAPDERTRIGLSLRLQDRRYHFPTDATGAVVDHNAYSFADETTAHLSLSRSLTGWLEVEALVGLAGTDGGTDDAPDDDADAESFTSLDHFRRTSGQVRAHARFAGSVLTAGAEVEEERQRSFSESASAFGTSFGRSESARTNLAAFAHLSGERGPVAYGLGARVADNEGFGTAATWQAGMSVALPRLDGTRLTASVGTALKEPTFFENFATGFVVGNPDLDPERSRAWEVGLRHDAEAFALSASYFDQRLEDLIQYTPVPPSPGGPNYFNVAEARSRGVELSADVRLGRASAGASYTWLDTEAVEAGFDSGPDATFVEGERLLRRPAHQLAVRASAQLGDRAAVHGQLSVVGERADLRFDPATFASSRVELERYALVGLGGEWDAVPAGAGGPALTLTLRAENLLDERYEEAWGFRAPGRQAYLGVRVTWGGGS
ncbi:MAG TPA: TonB-dependent receptor [Longimicrobiales bacterium]|nr:TonB-dependent receptor [Longimicrobiales bacterium]